jgi:hypothetical protein
MNSGNKGGIIMKRVNWILVIMFLSLFSGFPLSASAVSPSPIPDEHEERIAKGIKVKGETVCLFQILYVMMKNARKYYIVEALRYCFGAKRNGRTTT